MTKYKIIRSKIVHYFKSNDNVPSLIPPKKLKKYSQTKKK